MTEKIFYFCFFFAQNLDIHVNILYITHRVRQHVHLNKNVAIPPCVYSHRQVFRRVHLPKRAVAAKRAARLGLPNRAYISVGNG